VTVHGWRDTLIHVVATVRAEAMTAGIARTLNGPVEIIISSAGYSAALEASTVTGRLTSDLDASSHRAGSRTLEKRLGRGGPPLRLTTINGAVSVHRN
jgi:hypothetical protein